MNSVPRFRQYLIARHQKSLPLFRCRYTSCAAYTAPEYYQQLLADYCIVGGHLGVTCSDFQYKVPVQLLNQPEEAKWDSSMLANAT